MPHNTHKNEPHDSTQWPPPVRVPNKSEQGLHQKKKAKLITGTIWADALLGSAESLPLFTLLTFIIANPLMWQVAPNVVPQYWSTHLRLLIGWSLASVVQLLGGIFFWRQGYEAFSRSMIWTTILVASFWLLVILIAWRLFG